MIRAGCRETNGIVPARGTGARPPHPLRPTLCPYSWGASSWEDCLFWSSKTIRFKNPRLSFWAQRRISRWASADSSLRSEWHRRSGPTGRRKFLFTQSLSRWASADSSLRSEWQARELPIAGERSCSYPAWTAFYRFILCY